MTLLFVTPRAVAESAHALFPQHTIIHALTTPIALARARDRRPVAILCDAVTVQRGDLLPLLLARPETAAIPVILIAAQHIAAPPNVLMRVRDVTYLPDAVDLVTYDPS